MALNREGEQYRLARPSLAPEETFPKLASAIPCSPEIRNSVSLRTRGFIPQSGSLFQSSATCTLEHRCGRCGPPKPTCAFFIVVNTALLPCRSLLLARNEMGI